MPSGHSAQDCDDTAKDVLARFGITKEDIFSYVNDTTNSSVETGWLLSGDDGGATSLSDAFLPAKMYDSGSGNASSSSLGK